MKLVYKCHYDGNKCNVIPAVMPDGTVVEMENETWDTICKRCPRNYSLGRCYGILAVEGGCIESIKED